MNEPKSEEKPTKTRIKKTMDILMDKYLKNKNPNHRRTMSKSPEGSSSNKINIQRENIDIPVS